jgi:hypothetical protein
MAKKPKLGKRGEGTSSFLGDDVGRQHILALEHLPGPSVVETKRASSVSLSHEQMELIGVSPRSLGESPRFGQ